MSVISLPEAALSACAEITFELMRSQEVQTTIAGVSQVTSFPDRRWRARLQVVPQATAQLRAWSLALDQLSDLTNVVALSPPHYEAPSTGYAGPSPVVEGGSQLGLTLNCDGVTPSVAILSAGDYFSFDVTSPLGSTNRQLNRVTVAATADGTGDVDFTLMLPIRQAPADNAAVNITTPSAFFRLAAPLSTVDLRGRKMSTFVVDLEERIFP